MLSRQLSRSAIRAAGIASRPSVQTVRQIHSTSPLKKDEEPLEPGWVEKFQLTEPSRYVPLTIVGFGVGSLTGLYHFDAESQLLALWVLFCGTVYSKGSPTIAAMMDDMKKQVADETAKLESAEIEALKVALDAHKRQVAIYDDIKALFDSQTEIMSSVVTSAQNHLKQDVRTEFVRKLDSIVALEEKIAEDTKKELLNGAAKSVRDTFSTSAGANLKANALSAALEALGNPSGSKKDPTVSNLYSNYFKEFAKKVADAKTKEVSLTPEMIAAVKESVATVAARDEADISNVAIPSKVALGNI